MSPIQPLVPSFAAAQMAVPFPVQAVPGSVEEIRARPGRGTRCPTVRSVHRQGEVRFRIKQYARDWWGHFGAPNKLYTTTPDRWELYGKTIRIPLGARSAFLGVDFAGFPAASMVTQGMHVELRVLTGSLGPGAVRSLFLRMGPAEGEVAEELGRLPLPFWNWTLITSEPQIRWTPVTIGGAPPKEDARAPALPGWTLDCVGRSSSTRPPALDVRYLYRSTDRETILELRHRRLRTGRSSSVRGPQPPLFAPVAGLGEGMSGFRSRVLEWAVYALHARGESVTLYVPPGRSQPARDRALLEVSRAFLRSGNSSL